MAKTDKRIVVVDSTCKGVVEPLPHTMYAIVYTPSWLRVRWGFQWKTSAHALKTLETMKEYYTAAPLEERPIRAQRCLYSIKSLNVYGYRQDGVPRFQPFIRTQLKTVQDNLVDYLDNNPVVAWDWVVSWSECFAMAEVFTDEYVRMYRRLRSHWSSKGSRQLELRYFLDIMEIVADERRIDMEFKV